MVGGRVHPRSPVVETSEIDESRSFYLPIDNSLPVCKSVGFVYTGTQFAMPMLACGAYARRILFVLVRYDERLMR